MCFTHAEFPGAACVSFAVLCVCLCIYDKGRTQREKQRVFLDREVSRVHGTPAASGARGAWAAPVDSGAAQMKESFSLSPYIDPFSVGMVPSVGEWLRALLSPIYHCSSQSVNLQQRVQGYHPEDPGRTLVGEMNEEKGVQGNVLEPRTI